MTRGKGMPRSRPQNSRATRTLAWMTLLCGLMAAVLLVLVVGAHA